MDAETTNLSVSGNALFFHDGYSLFRYNDNGASCDSIWEYDFSAKANRGIFTIYTLPIGEDGNIISVSSEQSMVRCFKGDGKGLATGGWPKPFGDYGNTSSK